MRLASLICLALMLPTARAAEPLPLASGAQLRQAVSGNTITGSMDAGGRYTEYYAADGSVRAKGYTARWSIEGNSMCWRYEGQPKDCWQATLKGAEIKWLKDGKAQGSGSVLKGNPDKL